MFVQRFRFRLMMVAIAAVCCASPGLQAAESAGPAPWQPTQSQPSLTSRPSGPSANNDAFIKLRAQCDTEVPCGKAHGEVCVAAAALLLGDDLPDEFREIKEDQRIKIALRLLERGVDSSNVARGRAYDYYNRVGFLGISAYADPYRAKELMDMMVKSGYAGGPLRRIRSQTSILSITSSEAEKREGCATAKKMLSEGKLDADSMKLATDIVGSPICTGYEPPAK